MESMGYDVQDAPLSPGKTAPSRNIPQPSRICIDLLSILAHGHAKVVSANAAAGDNS
jgi:hypothetical protein